MVGKNENILVEFDYQNVVLVDPNKIVDSQGFAKERLLRHEDLVYYANLECSLFPRTRLAQNPSGYLEAKTIQIATVNFLKPNDKDFLDNEYLNEITGFNSIFGKGDNQIQIVPNTLTKPDKSIEYYFTQTNNNRINNNLLLISSITVDNDMSGFPKVRIEMEDIRGRALFELGENSPYAIFFNYPYPLFYLTLKGYLGKAIKYQLALKTFNSKFDGISGNFKITCEFYAYKYNILTQLTMGQIMATPYMYQTNYEKAKSANANQQSAQNQVKNDTAETQDIFVTKGYLKIQEVYADYKSLGLIDADFPEITVTELIARMDTLVQKITKEIFNTVDVQPLTDGENYGRDLNNFEKKVFLARGSSWFYSNMDTENFFIQKGTGEKIYTFKNTKITGPDNDLRLVAKKELEGILGEWTQKLNENPTFGKDSGTKYSLEASGFNLDMFLVKDARNQIDYEATYQARTKKKNVKTGDNKYTSEYNEFVQKNIEAFLNSSEIQVNDTNITVTQDFFIFDGKNSFTDKLQIIRNKLNAYLEEIQNDLQKKLSERLRDKSLIGFKPTIRNILAVIFASAEGFLRLMCDVHENAWKLNKDKNRRNAILDNNKTAISSDSKQSVSNSDGNLIPIYPWPQFFVETTKENGEKFEIQYIGDSKYSARTKAYDYSLWPEVEFLEEFLNGKTLIKQPNPPKLSGDLSNPQQQVQRISLAAIDFPTTNIIFLNKQEVKFIYEIWERLFLYANYQRFRGDLAQNYIVSVLADAEFQNINFALSNDNPALMLILKNYNLNSGNLKQVMFAASNDGTGASFQKFVRDEFVTKYIKNEVDNPFVIYTDKEINSTTLIVNPTPENFNKLTDYLKDTLTNETNLLDTFPFAIDGWFKTNMANGNASNFRDLYNTTKTYLVHDDKKMVSNYGPNSSKSEKRPITNFNFYNPTLPDASISLKIFYQNRSSGENIKNQQITEGSIFYKNYSGNTNSEQTTSILNTPYFVNAILKDVELWLSGANSPFIRSAFLFLNSLPISTFKERYKTYKDDITTDLDYIFASIKKFGAIHKVPYALVLKYGALWHRYKYFIENGVDILNDVWTNFDEKTNYDPLTQSKTKVYNLTLPNETTPTQIVLESSITAGAQTINQLNLGFYPKTINDFSYFLRGYGVLTGYTDAAIQSAIDNIQSGITVNLITDSTINLPIGYDPNNLTDGLSVKTWMCTLIESTANKEFILPSFGSTINQINTECFDNNNNLIQPIMSNPAIYNGSVRCAWALPNYGYFDNSNIDIPQTNQYFKKITNTQSQQESFSFRNSKEYTYMDEMLSVFDKEILDLLEEEFFKFTKSCYEYETDDSNTNAGTTVRIVGLNDDADITYKNFQVLIREIMSISPGAIDNSSSTNRVQSIAKEQFKKITDVLKNFMEYDVVLKNGNPGSYNRRLFDSFIDSSGVQDKISFGGYEQGTVPSSAITGIPLINYKTTYAESWIALETYVGFSEIDGIKYTETGSTITDFFIDMNVEFTPEAIQTLAPLIKIYATQKKLDSTLNKTKFQALLNQFNSENITFTNTLTDLFFTKVRTILGDIKEVAPKNQNISVEGEQLKVQLWEFFKALNDNWISGYDYTQTTFMEDVLLMDRANRNIGDEVYIDPFKISSVLNKTVNEDASVFIYINSILTDHSFICMMQPAYINFYNVQEVSKGAIPKIEGHLEFGNNLFGTFLNVDTRAASPKLVCTFAAEPSQYLSMNNNDNFRFKSDAFDLTRASDCPVTENLVNKKDWALSNRVVGFNVDIGIRNQNIFYNFDVGQEMGVNTNESLMTLDRMIENSAGRGVASQNVSLWNYYKNRSYKCTVRCLGNVMIQPTMYFNLRHVPMFNGPYLITSVSHSLTPGKFETKFTGTRQQIFALPKLDFYLQALTKKLFLDIKPQLLKQINTNEQNNAQANANPNNSPNAGPTTTVAPPAVVQNTGKIGNSNNCSDKLYSSYSSYTAVTNPTQTFMSEQQMADGIKSTMSTKSDVTKALSFVTVYLASNSNGQFTMFNNNYAGVRLDYKWSGQLPSFFGDDYFCNMGADGYYYPYATFETPEKLYQLLEAKWSELADDYQLTPESLLEAWLKRWNKTEMSESDFNAIKNNPNSEYPTLLAKVTEALNKAKILKLINDSTQPSIFIVNKVYDLNGNITSLRVEIDPTKGIWKMTKAEGSFNITAQCESGGGFKNYSVYISADKQSFFVTIGDLISPDCLSAPLNERTGTYTYDITIDASPYLSNGVLDSTKSAYFETFRISRQI